MYTEPKHRLFERLNDLPDFEKGYLTALVEMQKNIYGSCIIKDALTPDILKAMTKVSPVFPHDDGFETISDIYTDYYLLREVTARERKELISALGMTYGNTNTIHLYTHDTSLPIKKVQVFSEVDYYNQMPYVFKNSHINLNISLRSILSGIPLRAIDIMGCGGFLLTNYQADFLDYLTPDTDFVYYENKEDLLDKVGYYLTHEKERERIARNGYQKALECFDYHIALEKMLEI